MHAFYSDRFVLPLPPGHRFPMEKYRRLRERCVAEGVLRERDLFVPEPATWGELARVHDADYLARVRDGSLSAREQRRIGFPWSPEMVERSRRSAGGTLGAARRALSEARGNGWKESEEQLHGRPKRNFVNPGARRRPTEAYFSTSQGGRRSSNAESRNLSTAFWGVAANLAGGTHHAHAGHGEGFCVFNDAAVTVRALQRAGEIQRAVILDCDVHQGNGTAAIFRTDPTVFTFSIHGARNFPFRKVPSALDIDLPDGAGDDAFLAALDAHLPHALADFEPELIVYLAGADPYRDDRFGRLALSKDGLQRRDRMILKMCRRASVPVAVVMAGGYARDTADTVAIHANTIRVAAEMLDEMRGAAAVK